MLPILAQAQLSDVNSLDWGHSKNSSNVLWQVDTSATLGQDSDFVGNLVALDSISLEQEAKIE